VGEVQNTTYKSTYEKPLFMEVPRKIIIKKSPSSNAWFNNLAGESFDVLEVNDIKTGVRICINEELKMYGWLPLTCCKSKL